MSETFSGGVVAEKQTLRRAAMQVETLPWKTTVRR